MALGRMYSPLSFRPFLATLKQPGAKGEKEGNR
jgi:hypothetical protein